jgi:hypothetical protein
MPLLQCNRVHTPVDVHAANLSIPFSIAIQKLQVKCEVEDLFKVLCLRQAYIYLLKSTTSGMYRYIPGSGEARGISAEVTLGAKRNLLHISLNAHPINKKNYVVTKLFSNGF